MGVLFGDNKILHWSQLNLNRHMIHMVVPGTKHWPHVIGSSLAYREISMYDFVLLSGPPHFPFRSVAKPRMKEPWKIKILPNRGRQKQFMRFT